MEGDAPEDRRRTLTAFESLQRPHEFIEHPRFCPKIKRGFGCNLSSLKVKVPRLLERRDIECRGLVIMKAGLKRTTGVFRPSVSSFEIVDAAMHLPTERRQSGSLIFKPFETDVG